MNGLATWNPARLAEARRAAGLSQEALADRLTTILQRDSKPIRTRNIVRWERPRGANGAHAPHVDFIAAIAEATSRETDFFLTGDDSEDDDAEAARMVSLDDFLRIRVREIMREERKERDYA